MNGPERVPSHFSEEISQQKLDISFAVFVPSKYAETSFQDKKYLYDRAFSNRTPV